jgi:hypothetical protein
MKITGSQQLKEVIKNQEYDIDYGTIKYGSNTLVNIKLEGVQHVSVSKTCGCTTPTVEIQPDAVMIAVSYDNKKLGTINQRVTERCTDSTGTQKIINFNLKGNIIE